VRRARPDGAARSAVHWFALVVAAAVSWVPIVGLSWLVAIEAPGTIHHAEIALVAASSRPPTDAVWTAATLPDDWRATHPEAREVWYRLRFERAAATGDRLGVYLPMVAMNASVFVNGRLVGSGGRFTEPIARNWNRPLLFAVPTSVLVPGANVLHVRVVTDLPGNGLVPAPAVAPLAVLAPIHQRAAFVRRTLLWTLIVFRLVVAAFTAAIFVMWRRETYYGWFALCAVAWVLAEVNLVAVDIPVSVTAWYWLFNVAIGWWGIFAVRLVLSFIGVAKPRAERGLMIAGALGSAALAVLAATGSPHFNPLAVNLWLTLAFGASCYLFRGVLPRLRDYPDAIELNVVFVVASSVIGCVLFDLLMQLGLRPRGGLTLPPYSAFVAVVGMGWVLVRRFVGALREARALAATLEQRVREQTAEVEASYGRILATERARVLSEERERILRDMDEGLGSQLVSTLAMTERPETSVEELQGSVRAALDDLRLVIDSLDPLEGELLPALAMLRSRLQPRLDAAGVAVEWRVADLPPLAGLTPHGVLQILRLVQRAFTDVLSRGQGGRLGVHTGTEVAGNGTRAAFVEIVDGAAAVVRLALPLAEGA
jgi:signal transduction histidine kinase